MKAKSLIIVILLVISGFTSLATVINVPDEQPTIQEGINASFNGDTVLVAPGTYFESIDFIRKNITVASHFLIIPDLNYIQQTIIDGNGMVVVSFVNEEDSTSVLCGFTIQNGSSNDGGGIYCYENTSPLLRNLVISDNTSLNSGGGLYMTKASPVIQDVFIRNNSGGDAGGGVSCINSSPVFVNVIIEGNTASNGGGIFKIDSSPLLYNVMITGNIATSKGAGMYMDNSDPYLEDVTISGNGSGTYYGGGIYCKYSNPEFENVLISDNQAVYQGGGLYCQYSNLRLINVSVTNNQSSNFGGGIYCLNCNPYFEQVSVSDNTAGSGGGVFLVNSSPLTEGLIISKNEAVHGGGLYLVGHDTLLANIIISDNIANYGGGIFLVTSNPFLSNISIIKNKAKINGGGIYTNQSATIDFDPDIRCNIYLNQALIEGNEWFTNSPQALVVDTFVVKEPNALHITPLSSFTFDILNGKIAQADADVFVSPSGSDNNSGLTSSDPLQTIYAAFMILKVNSENPHTIHLLEGNYSATSNGDLFPIKVPDFINFEGVSESLVVMDAEGESNVFLIEDSGPHRIAGMRIIGASSSGIYVSNSDIELENVTITNNTAPEKGGGIYASTSTLNLENVKIFDNSAPEQGGGIFSRESELVLNNIEISSNYARFGGGIYQENSISTISNATFFENEASYGGAICNYINSSPVCKNVVILNNKAWYGAGICNFSHSSPVLENVTVHTNIAEVSGGGIYGDYYSVPVINNSIIYQNTPNEIDGEAEASYSDIKGGWEGEGNIDADPLFCSTWPFPCELKAGSPCIDAGVPDTTGLNLLPCDRLGNCRLWDGDGDGTPRVDMGAYEYGSTPMGTDQLDSWTVGQLGINIYPNPTNEIFNFQFSTFNLQRVSLKIYDIHGQEVAEVVNEQMQAGENVVRLDASWLPAGVYFYRLAVGNQRSAVNGKLVKL